jgi:hypothetical protein
MLPVGKAGHGLPRSVSWAYPSVSPDPDTRRYAGPGPVNPPCAYAVVAVVAGSPTQVELGERWPLWSSTTRAVANLHHHPRVRPGKPGTPASRRGLGKVCRTRGIGPNRLGIIGAVRPESVFLSLSLAVNCRSRQEGFDAVCGTGEMPVIGEFKRPIRYLLGIGLRVAYPESEVRDRGHRQGWPAPTRRGLVTRDPRC